MFFFMIPDRWLEYEPPGMCHIPALGVIASIGGTIMSMRGQQQQADYQEAVARNNAIALKQKANEDAAIGQRAAATESRKADLVQSRARSLGAASGTAVASPTQLNIEAGIAGQGDYNALSALYEGMSRSRASNQQADLELFKADRIDAARPIQTMSGLFSGASSLARGVSSMGGSDTAGSFSDLAEADQTPATPTGLIDPYRSRRRNRGLGLLDILY
jgi:hypothetical protein